MRFCAKKLPKTKISFHAQLSKKRFPVLRKKNGAEPCKTHCVSCAKIAQKFAKIAQFLRKKISHFVETLSLIALWMFCKQKMSWELIITFDQFFLVFFRLHGPWEAEIFIIFQVCMIVHVFFAMTRRKIWTNFKLSDSIYRFVLKSYVKEWVLYNL